MKNACLILFLTISLGFTSCSNQNTGINDESGSADTAAENDSATTNPVNSEYGTPNATENKVDSAQDANEENSPQ